MPTPSFPVINQQPPTALRVYDYFTKKARFRSECVDSYRDCPYKLLTTPENFLPFQFVRPASMEQIDTWKVYDLSDNLVLTLDADDIALLTITPKSGGDFITYNGGELSEALPVLKPFQVSPLPRCAGKMHAILVVTLPSHVHG